MRSRTRRPRRAAALALAALLVLAGCAGRVGTGAQEAPPPCPYDPTEEGPEGCVTYDPDDSLEPRPGACPLTVPEHMPEGCEDFGYDPDAAMEQNRIGDDEAGQAAAEAARADADPQERLADSLDPERAAVEQALITLVGPDGPTEEGVVAALGQAGLAASDVTTAASVTSGGEDRVDVVVPAGGGCLVGSVTNRFVVVNVRAEAPGGGCAAPG